MVSNFYLTSIGFVCFNGTYKINMIPIKIDNSGVIPNNPQKNFYTLCKVQAFKVVDDPFKKGSKKEIELQLDDKTKTKTFSNLKDMIIFIKDILEGKYDGQL
jgi:hypothetical protein